MTPILDQYLCATWVVTAAGIKSRVQCCRHLFMPLRLQASHYARCALSDGLWKHQPSTVWFAIINIWCWFEPLLWLTQSFWRGAPPAYGRKFKLDNLCRFTLTLWTVRLKTVPDLSNEWYRPSITICDKTVVDYHVTKFKTRRFY